MALPSSGTITAAMVNVELGRAAGAAFSINGAEERALAGKPTGAISFSDFYGKSSTPLVHFFADRLDSFPDIEMQRVNLGINQTGIVQLFDGYNTYETRYLPANTTVTLSDYEAMITNPTNIVLVGNQFYDSVIRSFNTWYTPLMTKSLAILTTSTLTTSVGYCTLTVREKANPSNSDTILLYVNYTNA